MPADARAICAAWGIDRPVAVSGEVHQVGWQVAVAGEELPRVVAGASPAYDFRVAGGAVRKIAIAPTTAMPTSRSGPSGIFETLAHSLGRSATRSSTLRGAVRQTRPVRSAIALGGG